MIDRQIPWSVGGGEDALAFSLPRLGGHIRAKMAEQTPVRAVILVGGPTRGTRFRPLSLDTPKPLFLLAGRPLIWHHIAACRRELPGLRDILLFGSYSPAEFTKFIEETQQELDVRIEFVIQFSFLHCIQSPYFLALYPLNGISHLFVCFGQVRQGG